MDNKIKTKKPIRKTGGKKKKKVYKRITQKQSQQVVINLADKKDKQESPTPRIEYVSKPVFIPSPVTPITQPISFKNLVKEPVDEYKEKYDNIKKEYDDIIDAKQKRKEAYFMRKTSKKIYDLLSDDTSTKDVELSNIYPFNAPTYTSTETIDNLFANIPEPVTLKEIEQGQTQDIMPPLSPPLSPPLTKSQKKKLKTIKSKQDAVKAKEAEDEAVKSKKVEIFKSFFSEKKK